MLISVNLSVTGLQFSRVLFFYNLHNHFGGIVEKRKKKCNEKTGQTSSSNAKCSLVGLSTYKVRSVVKYGCCLSNSTWGWDPLSDTQKAHYYSVTPPEAPQLFCLRSGWKRERERRGDREGGVVLSLKRSSTPLYGEGTSVNGAHSRGRKEALQRFVLEAVLLICLPTNECVGPVFHPVGTMALEARINRPGAIPRERLVLTQFPLSSRDHFPGHFWRRSSWCDRPGKSLLRNHLLHN